jgi:hypothetical protein
MGRGPPSSSIWPSTPAPLLLQSVCLRGHDAERPTNNQPHLWGQTGSLRCGPLLPLTTCIFLFLFRLPGARAGLRLEFPGKGDLETGVRCIVTVQLREEPVQTAVEGGRREAGARDAPHLHNSRVATPPAAAPLPTTHVLPAHSLFLLSHHHHLARPAPPPSVLPTTCPRPANAMHVGSVTKPQHRPTARPRHVAASPPNSQSLIRPSPGRGPGAAGGQVPPLVFPRHTRPVVPRRTAARVHARPAAPTSTSPGQCQPPPAASAAHAMRHNTPASPPPSHCTCPRRCSTAATTATTATSRHGDPPRHPPHTHTAWPAAAHHLVKTSGASLHSGA